MKPLSLLTLPLVVLAVAACGSSSSSSSSTSSPASTSASATSSASSSSSAAASSGSAVAVQMKNVAFVPTTIHAKVGQTITWTNSDTPPHNVTYVSGPKFTSSGQLNPGDHFSIKVTQAGTIHYFCTIHPFMKATIVVTQ